MSLLLGGQESMIRPMLIPNPLMSGMTVLRTPPWSGLKPVQSVEFGEGLKLVMLTQWEWPDTT